MNKHTVATDYYLKPCACGANPAWHLGHTQHCVDATQAKEG
jgi:hypothetical protein